MSTLAFIFILVKYVNSSFALYSRLAGFFFQTDLMSTYFNLNKVKLIK